MLENRKINVFIDKLATKIAVLERRKINVFDGTYADYLRVTGHA